MTEALSTVTFALALLLYAASSVLFYLDVARFTRMSKKESRPSRASVSEGRHSSVAPPPTSELAPRLLAVGALGHFGYVLLASFVAHVCPIHSVHFTLSVASLFATAAYLIL